ncbi:unnamed protein product, partial [Owenia fusiformis]
AVPSIDLHLVFIFSFTFYIYNVLYGLEYPYRSMSEESNTPVPQYVIGKDNIVKIVYPPSSSAEACDHGPNQEDYVCIVENEVPDVMEETVVITSGTEEQVVASGTEGTNGTERQGTELNQQDIQIIIDDLIVQSKADSTYEEAGEPSTHNGQICEQSEVQGLQIEIQENGEMKTINIPNSDITNDSIESYVEFPGDGGSTDIGPSTLPDSTQGYIEEGDIWSREDVKLYMDSQETVEDYYCAKRNVLKRERDKIKKRQLRQDPSFRDKERIEAKARMASKRKDPAYRQLEREKDKMRRRLARQRNWVARENERERDKEYKKQARTGNTSNIAVKLDQNFTPQEVTQLYVSQFEVL